MAMTLDNYLSGGYAAQNAMAQRRAQDAATWKTMLTQINNTRPETMLGYALGKLLRGAWDHRQRRAFEEKAKQEEANRQHRNQVSSRAAANAGLAPVKGMLGNGFDIARGFQYYTGGNNPIAWNAYGEATKAQQPAAGAPVEAKTTTTEYTIDPNQYSAVQMAQNTPTPATLTDRAAQIQQEMNLKDWWDRFNGRQG